MAYASHAFWPLTDIPKASDMGIVVGDGTYYCLGLTEKQLLSLLTKQELKLNISCAYNSPPVSSTLNGHILISPGRGLTYEATYDSATEDESHIEGFTEANLLVVPQHGSGVSFQFHPPLAKTYDKQIDSVAKSLIDKETPVISLFSHYSGTDIEFFTTTILIEFCAELFGNPAIVQDKGLFYPLINIQVYYHTREIRTYSYPASAGAMDFLGKSVNLYSYPVGSIVECTLSVTPHKYWPYDPGDTIDYPGQDGSGPVYDTDTGEQLRNPFNIVKRGDGTFHNPNYTV